MKTELQEINRLPGNTPAERYDYLMRHAGRFERRAMLRRRAEVQAWLRAHPATADAILGRSAP